MNWYLWVITIYLLVGLIIAILVDITSNKKHYFTSYLLLMIMWPYWLIFDYRYYVARKRKLRKGENK